MLEVLRAVFAVTTFALLAAALPKTPTDKLLMVALVSFLLGVILLTTI